MITGRLCLHTKARFSATYNSIQPFQTDNSVIPVSVCIKSRNIVQIESRNIRMFFFLFFLKAFLFSQYAYVSGCFDVIGVGRCMFNGFLKVK